MSITIVKQIKAIKNGVVEQVVRFNSKTNILYHQNRSKDVEMSIDEFSATSNTIISKPFSFPISMVFPSIAKNSSWSV